MEPDLQPGQIIKSKAGFSASVLMEEKIGSRPARDREHSFVLRMSMT